MTDKPDDAAAEGSLKVVPIGVKDELLASAESLKRNLETLIAHQMTMARIRRAAYLALVEVGFTEQQALELCCK